MKPVLHRVRRVTPSDREREQWRTTVIQNGEWPDWVVALSVVLLLAASAVTMGIILIVVSRAYWRIFHAG